MLFWRRWKRQRDLPEEGRTGDLAERILTLAVSCTDAVDQYVQSEGDGELTPLVFSQTVEEFVILFLHLTDRTAFQAVGATRRSELMDQLSPKIQSLLGPGSVKRLSAKLVGSCTWEDKLQVSLLARAGLSTKERVSVGKVKLESFFTFLPDDLNQRNAEYAGMKLFADTSEPLKGTLFWELGRHVSEVVVGARDAFIAMYAARAAMNAFSSLVADVLNFDS